MRRSLAVCFVLGLFFVPAQIQAKELTITWHGHSMFEIRSSKGTTIVVDPHNLEAYRVKMLSADAILITHPHEDHNDLRNIRNARSAVRLEGLKGTGRRQTWNRITDKKVNDFTISTVGGLYHDTDHGAKRGKMAAFVIDVDGFRIVHLGDLGHKITAEQAKKFGQVDILMIPVGGIYTINGAEAKEVVKLIKPRFAIMPMHYGTEVYDYVLKPDEFLEDQKNVKNLKSNKWTVEVGSKAPAAPAIIMMDWK